MQSVHIASCVHTRANGPRLSASWRRVWDATREELCPRGRGWWRGRRCARPRCAASAAPPACPSPPAAPAWGRAGTPGHAPSPGAAGGPGGGAGRAGRGPAAACGPPAQRRTPRPSIRPARPATPSSRTRHTPPAAPPHPATRPPRPPRPPPRAAPGGPCSPRHSFPPPPRRSAGSSPEGGLPGAHREQQTPRDTHLVAPAAVDGASPAARPRATRVGARVTPPVLCLQPHVSRPLEPPDPQPQPEVVQRHAHQHQQSQTQRSQQRSLHRTHSHPAPPPAPARLLMRHICTNTAHRTAGDTLPSQRWLYLFRTWTTYTWSLQCYFCELPVLWYNATNAKAHLCGSLLIWRNKSRTFLHDFNALILHFCQS